MKHTVFSLSDYTFDMFITSHTYTKSSGMYVPCDCFQTKEIIRENSFVRSAESKHTTLLKHEKKKVLVEHRQTKKIRSMHIEINRIFMKLGTGYSNGTDIQIIILGDKPYESIMELANLGRLKIPAILMDYVGTKSLVTVAVNDKMSHITSRKQTGMIGPKYLELFPTIEEACVVRDAVSGLGAYHEYLAQTVMRKTYGHNLTELTSQLKFAHIMQYYRDRYFYGNDKNFLIFVREHILALEGTLVSLGSMKKLEKLFGFKKPVLYRINSYGFDDMDRQCFFPQVMYQARGYLKPHIITDLGSSFVLAEAGQAYDKEVVIGETYYALSEGKILINTRTKVNRGHPMLTGNDNIDVVFSRNYVMKWKKYMCGERDKNFLRTIGFLSEYVRNREIFDEFFGHVIIKPIEHSQSSIPWTVNSDCYLALYNHSNFSDFFNPPKIVRYHRDPAMSCPNMKEAICRLENRRKIDKRFNQMTYSYKNVGLVFSYMIRIPIIVDYQSFKEFIIFINRFYDKRDAGLGRPIVIYKALDPADIRMMMALVNIADDNINTDQKCIEYVINSYRTPRLTRN